MGKYQSREYYDSIFATQKEGVRYTSPWPLNTEWYPRLIEVARLIDKNRTVVDLGCGFGILAGVLNWVNHTGRYRGYDFAKETIVWVNEQHAYKTIHPNARFLHADFTKEIDFIHTEENPTVVMCELLEHIPNDQEVVSNLPQGTDIIITLPTFDDPGHVRWFTSPESIRARYGQYIDFKYCGELYQGDHYLHQERTTRWLAIGECK